MPPVNLAVWRLWEALRMPNRGRYKVIHGHFPAVNPTTQVVDLVTTCCAVCTFPYTICGMQISKLRCRVKYRRYFPDAFYMTFFRHPVERLASHYFYWLRTPNLVKPHPLAHWLHEKSPDIVEFAERFHSRDEQLLHVKHFWPDDFDFIGITELCTEVKPQRVNAAKGVGGYDLSSAERSKLEEILWLRIAVYERARFLFEARRQLLS